MKTIKFLQESFETKERLDLIREEICELIGIDPNLEKQGHEDNYVFNLNIESDNQIGFFLQETKL